VYSSLFSSSVSKIMQFSSKNDMIGVFHLGDLKKLIIISKNQSYLKYSLLNKVNTFSSSFSIAVAGAVLVLIFDFNI
jgi:hypothetical protein